MGRGKHYQHQGLSAHHCLQAVLLRSLSSLRGRLTVLREGCDNYAVFQADDSWASIPVLADRRVGYGQE